MGLYRGLERGSTAEEFKFKDVDKREMGAEGGGGGGERSGKPSLSDNNDVDIIDYTKYGQRLDGWGAVSYTHLTLPTTAEV